MDRSIVVQRQQRRADGSCTASRSVHRRRSLDQLTDDPFADLEPAFLPDGRTIVFVTERFSTDLDTLDSRVRCGWRGWIWRHEASRADSRVPQGQAPEPAGDAPTARPMTFIARSRRDQQSLPHSNRRRSDRAADGLCSTGVAGITSSSPALSLSTRTASAWCSTCSRTTVIPSTCWTERQIVQLVRAGRHTNRRRCCPAGRLPSGDLYGLLSDSARGLPAPTKPRRRPSATKAA